MESTTVLASFNPILKVYDLFCTECECEWQRRGGRGFTRQCPECAQKAPSERFWDALWKGATN